MLRSVHENILHGNSWSILREYLGSSWEFTGEHIVKQAGRVPSCAIRCVLQSMARSICENMFRNELSVYLKRTGQSIESLLRSASPSAKCKSVRKPHASIPDTPVDLTGAPK